MIIEHKRGNCMTLKRKVLIGILAFVLALGGPGGIQAGNLVSNGGFETTTNGAGFQFESSQSGSPYTTATGWTSTNSNGNAYNFIFASGTADTTGVQGQYGGVALWGSNNGGLDMIPASSPDGGNFVAADGAFQTGAIQQTIGGLTMGATYQVGFYWAASQQSGNSGDTQQYWAVSLGSQTMDTPTFSLTSHAFSGWMYQTFNFTADGTSDVLSFLAVGSPAVPPFLLLDGVSMQSVPEPSSVMLFGAGLIGLVGVKLRRRRRVLRAAA
jgi:hypothetical protein